MNRIVAWFGSLSFLGKLVVGFAVGSSSFVCMCCTLLLIIGSITNSPGTSIVRKTSIAETIVVLDPTPASTNTSTPVPTDTPAPTRTQQPTRTLEPTVPPTSTSIPPSPSAVADTYQSGGLGLSRAAWEGQHGSPGQDIGGLIFYEGKMFLVGYQNGNVWHLEQSWGGDGIRLSEARTLSKMLLPADSKLIETYETGFGQTVELFMSQSLKSRFPETTKIGNLEVSMWTGGEPGNFSVSYNINEGRVHRIVLGLGNNP